MVVQLVPVNWKSEFFRLRSGWDIPENARLGFKPIQLLLSWKSLTRIPRSLREPNASKRFKESFTNTDFYSWWLQTCGSHNEKIFVLDLPYNYWNIPWELLIGEMRDTRLRSSVCIVRTSASAEIPEAPAVFNEPMRNLILHGDDGGSIGLGGLDLEEEARQIQLAWDDLEEIFKHSIEKPMIRTATRENVQSMLRDYKPHALWFSGHGLDKPETTLLFSGGDRVTPKELADLISSSGEPPIYAVFWACDTSGLDSRSLSVHITPALFKELSRVGVVSVLAMQAPIRDASASVMATDLFRQLASGKSLEGALAHARDPLIDNPPEKAHPLDWACPVIWSASTPVEGLHWSSDRTQQTFSRFQLTGRWALRLRLEQPAVLLDPPSEGERNKARVWVSQTRTWIPAPTVLDDFDIKRAWLRTLQAIPYENGNTFVLPVILRESNTEIALKNWAQDVHESMRPGDFPAELAQAISEMREWSYTGWQKLCHIPGIYLGIANPPPYNSQELFWGSLLNDDAPFSCVISNQEVTTEISQGWQVDKIEVEMDRARVEIAMQESPRLARALAVLNMPLNTELIYLNDDSGRAIAKLADWENRDDILIRTNVGPVISASARQQILERVSVEEKEIAHGDCIQLMTRPEMRLTPTLREHLVTHYLGANQSTNAVLEALDLCSIYLGHERPFATVNVVEKLGEHKIRIPPRWRLHVSSAYLQLGMLSQAQLWLDRSQPQSVLEAAWKHGIQHEIYKNEGRPEHKKGALEEIEEAIQLCEDALRRQSDIKTRERVDIMRQLLVYRHDRARILQYLFPEREQEAADEYSQLIKDLSTTEGTDLVLAAAKRNYSELLRKRTTQQTDKEFQRARELLAEAEELARDYRDSPLLAEILYEKAKLAERESSFDDSCACLQECISAANVSNHFMMMAIAKSRKFWKCEQFAPDRWHQVEVELERFQHGWALRTLIDGRLRAAKRCETDGDLHGMLKNLEANRDDLFRNPSFDQGSDRLRIMRTYTGLFLAHEMLQLPFTADSGFSETYPWIDDLIGDASLKDIKAIWQEVA